ncbi:flagellar hook-length control protein FliK [Sporosarcina sp. Sa2YVA2]|uniref:Flagellar hook-length control protein FliK n=1 Tax=Sporosarcina quadrami TaxID=2762234 RepID=A0ABR8U676_9BACL|nr:flagellar hook-length control protein FliK [Sporosarcina quadrami]MBD7983532.1 flagellar hook-length control protein FliK [Sporosarcina quadrami]
MNIGALQAMMGVGGKTLTNSAQSTESSMQSFGNVFAGITMKNAPGIKLGNEEAMKIPLEMIQLLFDAKTPEELEQALQAIPGYENIELSNNMEAIGTISSIEDLAKMLSVECEKLLETLKDILKKTNLKEEEIDGLTTSTDLWTLLSVIEKQGMNFFQQFNVSVEKSANHNEAINLLAFLKAMELTAPKVDMTLPMEQKMFSFQSMVQSASEQFQQLTLSANPVKQDVMQFINQSNFRVVVQADSASSTSDENATQKQPETINQVSNSANIAVTATRAEFSLTQTDSAGSSRSEALMREMQMLFKRSNFGQVGGSTRMLIKLYPEHLGQIRIELHETNGVLTARILASTALAKGMLDSQMHQLRNALAQQNLQVERIDVTQSIQESSKNEREQAFNEQFNREQKEESKQNNSSSGDDEMSFEEIMIELEV